jgi:putative thioredoxin
LRKTRHDHEARLQFAKILNAKGHRDAAAEELFTIMRKDRKWEDEAASKALLEFFEAWGPVDPATLSARTAAVIAVVLMMPGIAGRP